MTSKEKILETIIWLKDYRKNKKLNIVTKDFKEIDSRGLYITFIQEAPFEFVGVGTSTNKLESIFIATMEFIERHIMFHNKLQTSNGVATHFELKLCALNSKKELVERDAFMRHYLHMSLPQPLTISSPLHQGIRRKLPGIKILNLSLVNAEGLYIIQTILIGTKTKRNFGCTIGLGANKSLEQAVQKSMCEAIAPLLVSQLPPITIEDFNRLKTAVDHHFQLGLNTEYFTKYEKHFMKDHNRVQIPEILNISVRELSIPLHLNLPKDLCATIAESDNAQQPFWGKFDRSKVNPKRIEINNTDKDILTKMPHLFS